MASIPGPIPTTADGKRSRIIEKARVPVDQCYRNGLSQAPSMSGRMYVVIRFDKNGTVRDTTATPTGGIKKGVAECAVDGVKKLKFDPRALDGPSTSFVVVLTPR